MSTSERREHEGLNAGTSEWRSRFIDLASLDTPLRRILALGYAVLIGLGVATAAQAWLPAIEMVVNPGIRFPLVVVIIGGIGLSLAITLLLAGASQAGVVWRCLLFLPVFAWSIVFEGAQAAKGSSAVTSLVLFFLVAVGVLFLVGPRLGWRHSLLTSAAITVSFAGIATAISLGAIPSYAPTLVLLGLVFTLPVIDVALVVTGWDIAEVGLLAAVSLARRLQITGPWLQGAIRLALVAAAAAAALWLNETYHGSEGWIIAARAAGLALVILGVGWGIVHWGWSARGGAHDHVGYWSAFAVAVCLVLATMLPQTGLFAGPGPGAFNYDGPNNFSIVLPAGWHIDDQFNVPIKKYEGHPMAPVRRVFVPADRNFPHLAVYGTVAPPFAPAEKVLPSTIDDIVGRKLSAIALPLTVPDGTGWERGEVMTRVRATNKPGLLFLYWRREFKTATPATNKNWYLVCAVRGVDQEKQRPICEQLVKTVAFVPRLQLLPEAKFLLSEALWAVLALVAALAAWRGRRGPALAFLMWVALVTAVRNAGTLAIDVKDPLTDHGLSADVLCAALGLGAFATAGIEFAFFGFRSTILNAVREISMSFLLAMILLAAAFALYVYAGEGADKYHEIRGAVVCLALTWELWISGATMTNGDSTAFPRYARILAFLGYLLVIATCVFFFVERDFDFISVKVAAWNAEGWVAFGIVNLGLAFVMMRHVERLAAVVRDGVSGNAFDLKTKAFGPAQSPPQ